MVVRGHMQNGVVVLDEDVKLPDGQAVTVFADVAMANAAGHSVLDIRPVTVGQVLRPPLADDDLLGEMLEGRP